MSLLNLSANDIRKRAELGLVSQEVLSEESGEEEEEQVTDMFNYLHFQKFKYISKQIRQSINKSYRSGARLS